MSIKATNWAWEQTLEPTFKLVLMAICDCHNGSTGRCDPSYSFIAEKACVSERTAIRAVKSLVENGYISTLSSKASDGTQRTNTYVLNFENTDCQNVTQLVSRMTNNALPYDNGVTRNEPEEPEEKNIKKDDSIFKVFWDQYPNKTAKAYAEKLFSKLSPADQKLAIDSLPKFNAELTERRKTFKTLSAPNPSTYLNQRRFDDYKPAPVDWKEIMFAARKLNAWSPKKWGPAPFTTGCTVPKELLTQSDNRPWQEWKPPS
jgi:Helix-turn-helix domain